MSCQVWGDPNSPIMLVGMAPGKEELAQDMPFVGGSGALLWEVARDAGITRADCYIVNVIGEWPAKKDGSPSAEQIAKYRPAFEQAVAAFRGRIIVPLGKDALKATTGLTDGIESWRGYLVSPSECLPLPIATNVQTVYKTSNKKKGIKKGDPRTKRERVVRPVPFGDGVLWVLPTLHPAGVMRAGRKPLPAFVADWRRVGRALRNELWEPLKFKENKDGYLPILNGPFVVDVETMPTLRVGMAGRDAEGNPVAWSKLLDSECRAGTLAEYAVPGRTLVAHNVQFDLAALNNFGLGWDGPIVDTMLLASLLQPDLYKGLNEVASLYMDRHRWKHRSAEDNAAYNLMDAKVEYELYEILTALVEEEGMGKLFYGTIMPAVRVLAGMTKNGILVDEPARIAWLDELHRTQETLLHKWQGMVGAIDPGARKDMMNLIYGTWGLDLKRKRKTGAPTIERGALYELIAELPDGDPRRAALEVLIEYGKNEKLLTSFAPRGPGDDGCLHPYYLPVSKDSDDEDTGKGMAGTGRIQARDPNIQQLPPDARRIIVPRSGRSLVSFDFKQLELRIAASLSGDAVLSEDIEIGIFERICEAFKCDRTRAKNLVYGTIYGGGPDALRNALKSKGIKTTRAECVALQASLAARYPKLWVWRTHIKHVAAAQKFLRNPYGRMRYFYDKGKDTAAALDFLPQSTAADIVWSDFVGISREVDKYGGAILASVHDEGLLELPTESLSESIPGCRAILERGREELGGASFPVGVKVSDKNWKEVQPWNN